MAKKKKITVIGIHTSILGKHFPSKLVVSVFNLGYLLLAWAVIQSNTPILEVAYQYLTLVGILIGLRLCLAYFNPACGQCHHSLSKNNRVLCPQCGHYNVYDIDKWKQREFDNLKKIHWFEARDVFFEILAASIVSFIFIAPLLYFSDVVLNQPLSESLAGLIEWLKQKRL